MEFAPPMMNDIKVDWPRNEIKLKMLNLFKDNFFSYIVFML